MKVKGMLVGVVAVAMAASVSACGGGGGSDSKSKTFTFANIEPEHLIPGNTNDAYGLNVETALFDTLMALDASGKPVPQDAASVESPDQKVWTIKIKPGLTFLLFPLTDLNTGKLAMFKMRMQDRWFDDIINNMRAMGEARRG